MRRRDFLGGSALATLLLSYRGLGQTTAPQAPLPPLPAAGADGWISLLNGRDLSGWYSMLQRSGKGVAETKEMILMESGMVHILGNELVEGELVESGYLATNQEFGNVHIRVEYHWGMKNFAPRTLAKRDSGLLYGLVGEDRVWPSCVECQIEEGDVGDVYLLGGIQGMQDGHVTGLFGQGVSPNTGWPTPGSSAGRGGGGGGAPAGGAGAAAGRGGGGRGPGATPPPPGSPLPVPPGNRLIRDGDFENVNEWNVVEVIWQGDRALHLVNGRAVNSISRLQQADPQNPGQYVPLTRGKIALEIEYSEIWFRRVEVKSLV